MSDQFAEYGVEYQLDGKHWVLPIQATSAEDARRRLDRAAAFGKIEGPWRSHHVAVGWWVPVYCWVRNTFKF